jgi:hypothetical protein
MAAIMITISSGRFKVAPNERVNVRIEKSKSTYDATPSDLVNATWNPKPANAGGLTAEGGFNAPLNVGDVANFSILFNFPPSPNDDGSGDFYTVTFSGGAPQQVIFGPGFTTRTYFFEVA